VVFVEVAGRSAIMKNAFYIEALRELAFEEESVNVCFVALTYIIEPQALASRSRKRRNWG